MRAAACTFGIACSDFGISLASHAIAHTNQAATEVGRCRVSQSLAAQEGVTSATRSIDTPMARNNHPAASLDPSDRPNDPFMAMPTPATPKERPFKKITLKVSPFGTSATEFNLPIESIPQSMNPTRPKMIVRVPVLVQQIMLRPGKIETTVITESEELDAGGIWVMPVAPALP
jgi:hypothetical protein